ncbi:MAG TPA: hypothetical protein VFE28_11640 [Candidatus Krumholzibacteria bacterium]|nr:hypothetical protein [Candidatus Krumholzibacteria bacterium]
MRPVVRWMEYTRERLRKPQLPLDANKHLKEAMEWIHRAQDASKDRGAAHSYCIGKGWEASHPEATAALIPTLLNWSKTFRAPDAKRRALEMADWLLTVQEESGALCGFAGMPSVFDTGQVIFGWLAAYQETNQSVYLQAAQRAGNWLIGSLGTDSTWHGPLDRGPRGRAYHARIAWALLELGRLTNDGSYAAPMPTFLNWVLDQEHEDGWFDHNCLTDDSAPLLNTIAYAAQGLMESGLLLGSPEFIAPAERTAHELVKLAGPDGRMAGRFARGWKPAASWACLSGMAQMSILWQRLQELEEVVVEEDVGLRFLSAANRVNAFLMRTQDCVSENKGQRGGSRGSFPVSGAYGRWRVLSMGTKFFVDALLREVPGASLPYRY